MSTLGHNIFEVVCVPFGTLYDKNVTTDYLYKVSPKLGNFLLSLYCELLYLT